MTLISSVAVAAVTTNVRRMFNTGVTRAPQTYQELATVIPSTGAGEIFNFMTTSMTMREWIGERVVTQLKAKDFEIRNREYEATLEVPRSKIEDDQLGQYGMEAQMLGDAAGRLPEVLVYDLIKAGFTTNGYDGQFHFDTDHPVGSGTKSNKGTTALAADGVAYSAARAGMMSLTDDNGVPQNIVPDTLLVGPSLEGVARQLLQSPTVATGGQNIWQGTAKLIVSPYITDATDWFLFDTSKPIKPYIVTERLGAEISQQTDSSSDAVFHYSRYRYGARRRVGAGYALWQLAFGASVAG